MALTLTAAVKNKVARLLYSTTYSALSSDYRASLIDDEGDSALTTLKTYGSWFSMSNATAPDEWEPWLVSEICMRIAANAHPERVKVFTARRDKDMQDGMLAYARNAPTYDPSSVTEAFVAHTQNNRYYVWNHCIRRRPPLYPQPESIDAALNEVLTMVTNKARWPSRRRPAQMVITRTAFTSGTYTHSTKTISGLTSVSTSLGAGTRFYVTSGTGATTGEYVISSTTSTTIVLTTSIGSAADASTNIAGFYYVVTYNGLQPNESFDCFATARWYYEDADSTVREMHWLTADDFANITAVRGYDAGRPVHFRSHEAQSTTARGKVLLFSPPPDDDYTLRGEVFAAQPAAPDSTTDVKPFLQLAAEFMPGIRRLQLDRVLTNMGRHDAALHKEVMDEMESMFPEYASQGEPESRVGSLDVYGDVADISGGTMMLGEGM